MAYQKGTTKSLPMVREISALKGIKEGCERAAEMGRPVHYTLGNFGLTDPIAVPAVIASLSLLNYAANICAKNSQRIIVTMGAGDILPLATETVQQAYNSQGKPELFNPEDVIWVSFERQAYASGVMGLMIRENVGTNFMIGYFSSETLNVLDVG